MKSKLIKFFMLPILLMSMLAIPVTVALAATIEEVDFTTYTEWDTNSRATVTSSLIDINSIQETNGLAVYYDYGSSYFSEDWSVDFEFVDRGAAVGANYAIAVFGNVNPASTSYGWWDITTNTATPDHIGSFVKWVSGQTEWEVFEKKAGSSKSGSSTISYTTSTYLNVPVYLTMSFDDDIGTYGTMYISVYSDSDRSVQIGSTVSKALTEENSWRYFNAVLGCAYSANYYTVSFDVQNYELTVGAALSVETSEDVSIDYNWEEGIFYVELTGEVVAGEADIMFCATSLDQETYYPITLTSNGDGTYSGNCTRYTYLDEGDTVYYYVYAFNDEEEYAEGDEESFVLERDEGGIPYATLSDLVDVDDGVDVSLWWTLYDDGGESCNVTVAYSPDSWSTVYYTGNVTGKYNMDSGYGSVNMTEDTWYVAHAIASNSYGSSNSSDVYFIWYNQTSPEALTLPVVLIQDNQATFQGEVEDDGGGTCVVGFSYRELGSSTWIDIELDTAYGNVYETDDTWSYTKTGLQAGTMYEVMAIISNELGYNPYTGEYTYFKLANVVQFSTANEYGSPVMAEPTLTGIDASTVKAVGTMLNDGGTDVLVSLDYRLSSENNWQTNSNNDQDSGVNTGDTVTQYLSGLEYGKQYHIRWKMYAFGVGTYYSDYQVYNNWSDESGGDLDDDLVDGETTPETLAKDSILSKLIDWLTNMGMNNVAGKFFFIILGMVATFLLCHDSKIIRIVAPLLVFAAGIAVGFVDVVIIVMLALAAGGTVFALMKRRLEGR